jgi:pimeloyl-ACP methyl ester carboxylesterase
MMSEQKASHTAADRTLDVGGYRLHFRVFPGTGPNVLLEAGGGADADYWRSLPADLVRKTGATVIAYDRAGYAESDLPETPYDVRQEIAGLWRGLVQLRLAQSLIAVGHSYGGMLIPVLASEHPVAVSGLVFLDAMNVEFIDYLGGAQNLIHHRLMQFPIDRSHPEALPKPQRAALRVEAGLPGTVATVRAMPVPPHIPVRVITAGIPWWSTPAENAAWRLSHEHLAAAVHDGKLMVAEESAHLIPYDQPEILIAAIAELVHVV